MSGPQVHAFWFSSARVALDSAGADVKMRVESLVDNVVALARLSSSEDVRARLQCDDTGNFELSSDGVILHCHVDLFGTAAITVKRVFSAR